MISECSPGTGADHRQAAVDTAGSMGSFFRLHEELQVAVYDLLDFADR